MRYYSNFTDDQIKAKQQILKQILSEVNIINWTERITLDFFEIGTKYDFICSSLLYKIKSGNPMLYVDHQSVYLQLDILIYITKHLNKGGSAVIYLSQVKTQVYAELVQLYKDCFESVTLYYPTIKGKFEHSGSYLVCTKFIGVDQDRLINLFVENPDELEVGNQDAYDKHQVTQDVFKMPANTSRHSASQYHRSFLSRLDSTTIISIPTSIYLWGKC
jgi:hypothetical protein